MIIYQTSVTQEADPTLVTGWVGVGAPWTGTPIITAPSAAEASEILPDDDGNRSPATPATLAQASAGNLSPAAPGRVSAVVSGNLASAAPLGASTLITNLSPAAPGGIRP